MNKSNIMNKSQASTINPTAFNFNQQINRFKFCAEGVLKDNKKLKSISEFQLKKIKSEKHINRPDLKFTRIETLKKTITHLKKLDEKSKQILEKQKELKEMTEKTTTNIPQLNHNRSSKMLLESNKYKYNTKENILRELKKS